MPKKNARPLGVDGPLPNTIQGVRGPEKLPSTVDNISLQELLEKKGLVDLKAEQTQPERISHAPSMVDGPVIDGLFDIPVNQIVISPYQPRLEIDQDKIELLANAIQVQGLLRPILLRPIGDNQYELVGGERRWRAHQLIHAKTIRAHVRSLTDLEAEMISMADNEGQEELSDYERGVKFASFIARGIEQSARSLARRMGVSNSTVSRCIQMTEFPEPIKEILNHSPRLLGTKLVATFKDLAAKNPEVTTQAVNKIKDEGITQEAAIRWANQQINPAKPVEIDRRDVLASGKRIASVELKGKIIKLDCAKDIDKQKLKAAIESLIESGNWNSD